MCKPLVWESPFACFPQASQMIITAPVRRFKVCIEITLKIPEVWWNIEESVSREHLASASLFFSQCLSWDNPSNVPVSFPPPGESDATSATEGKIANITRCESLEPRLWHESVRAKLCTFCKKKKTDYNLENEFEIHHNQAVSKD